MSIENQGKGIEIPEEELLALFRAAATEVIGKSYPELTATTSLAELGIDSISSTEIIGKIEDSLGVRVPDESLAEIMTVQDLANALKKASPQF